MRLTGKVAAITVAASGIGLACAQAALAEGASVALLDHNEAGLTATCQELDDAAHPVVTDVLDPARASNMLPQKPKWKRRLPMTPNPFDRM